MSGLDGFSIFLGSIIGHSINNTGVIVGALLGGIAGVGVAVGLAGRFGLLENASRVATLVGGLTGFAVAAVIAVSNLSGPIIPVASVCLIGLGALIGKAVGNKQGEQANL